MRINKKDTSGTALFFVLILITVIGLLGMGVFKSSIDQMNIAARNVLIEKHRIAVDSAIELAVLELMNKEVRDDLVHKLVVELGERDDLSHLERLLNENGNQVNHVKFNQITVRTSKRYCGEMPQVKSGSDLALFSTNGYLVSGAGFDEGQKKVTSVVQQAIVFNNSEMTTEFIEKVHIVNVAGKAQLFNVKEEC